MLHLVHADIPCSFLLLLFDPYIITVCVQWSATAGKKQFALELYVFESTVKQAQR